ncbi:MAG: Gmad2 immunoglobulin-like domain-containing protein [Acidimicrobiales bacterium]
MSRRTHSRRPGAHRSFAIAVATPLASLALFVSLGLTACGDDDESSTTSAPVTSAESTTTATVPATTAPATTVAPTTLAPTTLPATTVTTVAPTTEPATTVPVEVQPAMWPAADVVLGTPEEAAWGFVDAILGVPPVLSEFRGGDSRSGEIDVMSAAEAGSNNVRSTLLLRQLGPDDGWFVIAAVHPMVSIDRPEPGAEITPGPLSVSGSARGYEATIIVKAFVAGTDQLVVEPVIGMGGSMETPEPYATTLDLTAAVPGTTLVLLARGDTGLETDPGEFSAIPLVVAG